MRILRIGGTSDETPRLIELHRRVTVVQGLAGARRARLIDAMRGVVAGSAGATGAIEAHGVEFEIDQRSLELLELRSGVDIVLRADQLPGRDHAEQETSVRLDRIRSGRRELVEQLEALHHEADADATPTDETIVPVPRAGLAEDDAPEGPPPETAVGSEPDRSAGALALAERWEQVEAQLATAGLRGGAASAGRGTVTDVARTTVRLSPDRSGPALAEPSPSGRRTPPPRRDIAAVEAAHTDVLYFEEKAAGRFGSGRARRRLAEARSQERVALDRLGLTTYAEFVVSRLRPAFNVGPERGVATGAGPPEASGGPAASEPGPDPASGAQPSDADDRAELADELSHLRDEVEEALGRPPGPFPAAELRAAIMLSPFVAPEPEGPSVDVSPAIDEEAQVDPAVEGSVAEAVPDPEAPLSVPTRREVDQRVLELEILAVDERIAELEVEVRSVPATADSTDEERVAAVEAIEWYVLARMAALRRISLAGAAPLIIDDAFVDLRQEDTMRLVKSIDRMAETVQVVIVSDDLDIAAWAEQAGPARAAIVAGAE